MKNSVEHEKPGHPFGVGRVLDTTPCMPQAADRLDNSLPIYSNEILIEVERLNIDAGSFVQMEEETAKDPAKILRLVMENTKTRGKQHNRVTGSGGMLMGRVAQIGRHYKGPLKCKVGDRVATLVSLTLTPLHLNEISKVHLNTHQMEVSGHAILFERSIAALLPSDLPETVATAAYDVAGAPALAFKMARPGKTVVVIGAGGKAGTLSCAAARKRMGKSGKIIAIEPFKGAGDDLKKLKVCNEIVQIDATNPIAVFDAVSKLTRGKMGDLVISVASVPNTENSALLSAKNSPKSKVFFFSTVTNFTKVIMGAEGIATEATLIFGNGYTRGHAKYTIDLLRANKGLKELFYRRYGG
jgi:L-erythro-3,5-diaminohexanoate dehydrogenase